MLQYVYACVRIHLKEEEEILLKVEHPKYFTLENIQIDKLDFKRYMDCKFLLWRLGNRILALIIFGHGSVIFTHQLDLLLENMKLY